MNIFFRSFILLFFIGVFQIGNAQNIEISGIIINAETKEPIPFANIALKEIYKGTAANALGEFAFKVDSLPIDLLFSHLSYEPKELQIINDSILVVELAPGKMMMDELVIKGKGKNKFAYNLVRNAFHKIARRKNSNKYGKAFYRQISKNGDKFSELYEIFYDTKYSLNGVDDWAIQEGRYALKLSSADSFIYNKNFTLMVRLLTIVQPKTDDLIVPISEDVEENYILTLERVISVNNRKLAQISFNKKKDLSTPAMEGELLIDVESYHVLKIKGSIADDKLKFISLKGEKGSWKNYVVTCEIAFKPVADEEMVLDYIKLEQNFDYYFNGLFTNKVETNSFFMYYEYYTPPKRKKLGGRLLRFNRRDADELDNIGYNQVFWDENIVVKRTPVEAEVISSFEEERAFGSIYINNKNQIMLEGYELDQDPFIVQVKNNLKQYDLPRKGEKVYIHHDKPFYVAGEKMWFKSYVVNMATNLLINGDDVLHIDLISPDGVAIITSDFKIKNGTSYGQLDIPVDVEAGLYQLRAYTGWMENFDRKFHYKKGIEIFNSSEAGITYKKSIIDSMNSLLYFPEGGKMIVSIPTQVGFIGKDEFGEVINLKARLIGQNGRMASNVKSENNLPGSIFLLPKSNNSLRTMVMSHEMGKVDFPDLVETGYSLMINNFKPNAIDITVRGSINLEGKKFYILVIANGVLFDKHLGLLTRGLFKLEIPKSKLPGGVIQILIVDEFGSIACNRLVYINQTEEASIKYYQAKKEFKRRERIDFVLELKNENGKPLNNANISIAILDKDKIARNVGGQNISTYFNFDFLSDYNYKNQGELIGNDDREALKKMDLIMLSQQTTLPNINSFEDVLNNEISAIIPKRGLAMSGLVTDKNDNKPLSNGFVTIVCKPDPSDGSWYVKTDQNGKFRLTGLGLNNSSWALAQAKNEQGEDVEINIIVEAENLSIKPSAFGTAQIEIPDYGKDYLEKIKLEIQNNSDSKSEIILYEKVSNKINRPFGNPNHVIKMNTNHRQYSNLIQVFQKSMEELEVLENGGKTVIKIKGEQSEPLIIMDGVLIYNPSEKSNGNVENHIAKVEHFTYKNNNAKVILSEIDPAIVDRVEVFDNATIALSEKIKSSTGIVAIYSNVGDSPILKTGNWQEILLRPVTETELFVSPDYSKDLQTGDQVDNRSTIYWNPQLITNRKGRVKIGFYNSDVARNLQICVEGITEDGLPIFDIYEIGRNYKKGQPKK